MKSWKTTVAGVAALLFAAALALQDSPNWEAIAALAAGGFGLVFARDNDVTSEEAGATAAKLIREASRKAREAKENWLD